MTASPLGIAGLPLRIPDDLSLDAAQPAFQGLVMGDAVGVANALC